MIKLSIASLLLVAYTLVTVAWICLSDTNIL